jgi:putative heme transporter
VCRWTANELEPAPARSGVAGRVRGWLDLARRTGAASLALPMKYRRIALAFAVANWLTDLCCLAAVAQAFHLPINLYQLGTVYVVVQLVRQVPVTPGGTGLIEASLLTALVAAGAAQGPAAATVLGYRLFSAWLIIPAGLFAWAMLRRKQRVET